MMYADYTYYTDVYGGRAVSAEDFPRLAAAASAHIDRMTFGRAAEHAEDDRLKRCCCDICDKLQGIADSGGAVKTSETVGSWSASYSVEGQSENSLVRSSCELWLPAEWLYRGVGRE